MPFVTLRSSLGAWGLVLLCACSDAGAPAVDGEEPVSSTVQPVSLTMLGADVSSVQRSLALGASYYDASGAIGQLQTDVYNYTFDVCNSLKAQGRAFSTGSRLGTRSLATVGIPRT